MSTPHSAAAPPAPSRTATPSRDTGSRTMELTEDVVRLSAPSGVLRLRAEPSERRHIQWAEDVVDNEGMGKKSSKGTVSAAGAVLAWIDLI
jgi:protein phosphatase 1 regulatory subunit 11